MNYYIKIDPNNPTMLKRAEEKLKRLGFSWRGVPREKGVRALFGTDEAGYAKIEYASSFCSDSVIRDYIREHNHQEIFLSADYEEME
ncbi:MAG: hypothetical protein PHC62_06870 [Candidatus Izemoplasmatales bacterium]|nr:hypothetical protein [Candidatus Izemoplasmatales bacterium]